MRPEEELGRERVFPRSERTYEAARAALLERVLAVVPDALERSPDGVRRLIEFAMGSKAKTTKTAETARTARKGKAEKTAPSSTERK